MSSLLIIHEANPLTHFPKQETRSIKIFVFSLDLNYKQEIIYLSLPFEWTNNDVTYNYQVHKIVRPLTSSKKHGGKWLYSRNLGGFCMWFSYFQCNILLKILV